MSKSTVKDPETPVRQYSAESYELLIERLVDRELGDALTALRTSCLSSDLFDEAVAHQRKTGSNEWDAPLDVACDVGDEIRRQLTVYALGGGR